MARDLEKTGDPLIDEAEEIKSETDDAFGDNDLLAGVMDHLDGGDGEEVLDNIVGDEKLDEGDEEEDDKGEAGGEPESEETDGAEPKAGVDRGDGRDEKGQFTPKQQEAADKATADAKAAGKTPAEQKVAADAAAAAAKPAEPAKTAWEPFGVRAAKAIVPIDEAKVAKVKDTAGNDHFLIQVSAKDFPRFQARLGRAHIAEQKSREIAERERELEIERNGPKLQSDDEIEAKIMLEAVKPFLAEMFTPEQLETLELKVKLAKHDAKEAYETARSEARTQADSAAAWPKQQVEMMLDQAIELAESHPDLAGITADEIRDALKEFGMDIKDQIVFREEDGVYANTELLLKVLKRGRSSSPAPAAPKTGQPAAADQSTKDDRFNKAQGTAAQPQSTSLKNRRTVSPPVRRPTRAPAPVAAIDERQAAEDDYRRTVRAMNRSSTLDFDDTEDDAD